MYGYDFQTHIVLEGLKKQGSTLATRTAGFPLEADLTGLLCPHIWRQRNGRLRGLTGVESCFLQRHLNLTFVICAAA